MFLSVDLLFFWWGKIGELYVCVSLLVRSVKVFFSGGSRSSCPLVWNNKKGRVWLFFYGDCRAIFFVGFCQNRPKRENIFWESGFSFVFFLYFLSQSYFFSQPFIIFFWEFALKNTWKDDSRLRCFSRRTSSFFAGFFWDRKDFWPFPSVF